MSDITITPPSRPSITVGDPDMGTDDHRDLQHRDAEDSHPIDAITGLQAALDAAGGGAVDSVNGQTGTVVLDAGDVGADPAGSAAAVGDDLATHAAVTDGTVHGIATLIAAAIANLVDTAPSTLDTLNELAAALGDDPNFATTVTGLIAAKLNASAVSAFGLTLLDDADSTAARSTLDVPQTPLAVALAIAL